MHPKRIREKKHRLARAHYRGEVFVVFTLCLKHRQQFFVTPSRFHAMKDMLTLASHRFLCRVPIFCFMPDHLHVMVEGFSKDSDTWAMMVHFKQKSGYWLRKHGESARWQKDFYDHIIRKSEDLVAQMRYIAYNPVRAGIVAHWYEYPYVGAIGYDLREILRM